LTNDVLIILRVFVTFYTRFAATARIVKQLETFSAISLLFIAGFMHEEIDVIAISMSCGVNLGVLLSFLRELWLVHKVTLIFLSPSKHVFGLTNSG